MAIPLLLIYFALKYAVYTTWCALGLRWLLAMPQKAARRAGPGWGLLRLLMGFALGLVIPEVVTQLHLAGQSEGFGLYLMVYVPTRVVEWGAMLVLFAGQRTIANLRREARRIELEPRLRWGRGLPWVAGGIVISCLADIPVFIALGGFPIGRFWC